MNKSFDEEERMFILSFYVAVDKAKIITMHFKNREEYKYKIFVEKSKSWQNDWKAKTLVISASHIDFSDVQLIQCTENITIGVIQLMSIDEHIDYINKSATLKKEEQK